MGKWWTERGGAGVQRGGENGLYIYTYHIKSRKGVDISTDCHNIQEFYLTYTIVMYSTSKVFNLTSGKITYSR
jgi:hypothetical protein